MVQNAQMVQNGLECSEIFKIVPNCPILTQKVIHGPKGSQMVPNGPKCSILVKNVPKGTTKGLNSPKGSPNVQIGPNYLKWFKIVQRGSKLSKMI